jgi:3-isopropylmalate dehydratase small subunit
VVLPEEDVRAVMEAGEATVDLERQVVEFDGREVGFHVDEDARYRLLNGLDEIGITLKSADEIDAYEREREREGPVTTTL